MRASAVSPLTAHPMCESISNILSMLLGTISGDVSRFSTASTTPSPVWIPIAVEPNYAAVRCHDSRYLDRLDGILDLEEAALGGECVHAAVVLGAVLVHFN